MNLLSEFLDAYIEAALWSSNDESTPEGGEPMDKNYCKEDIATETLERMRADCLMFIDEAGGIPEYNDGRNEWSDAAKAGHDFWLSRNGHGAGFFDRGLGSLGDLLQQQARAFGEYWLYIGDDGLIYGSS